MGKRPSEFSKISDDDVLDAVADSIFTDYNDDQKKFIQMLSDPFTTLCQALWYWFDNHGLKYPENFHDATKLHKNYHTDIKNDAKNDMGKEMLMAICVGCKFDLRMMSLLGLPMARWTISWKMDCKSNKRNSAFSFCFGDL